MAHSIAWSQVSRDYVLRAVAEYDRLGAQQFFADHGFAPAICIARRQPINSLTFINNHS